MYNPQGKIRVMVADLGSLESRLSTVEEILHYWTKWPDKEDLTTQFHAMRNTLELCVQMLRRVSNDEIKCLYSNLSELNKGIVEITPLENVLVHPVAAENEGEVTDDDNE